MRHGENWAQVFNWYESVMMTKLHCFTPAKNFENKGIDNVQFASIKLWLCNFLLIF